MPRRVLIFINNPTLVWSTEQAGFRLRGVPELYSMSAQTKDRSLSKGKNDHTTYLITHTYFYSPFVTLMLDRGDRMILSNWLVPFLEVVKMEVGVSVNSAKFRGLSDINILEREGEAHQLDKYVSSEVTLYDLIS